MDLFTLGVFVVSFLVCLALVVFFSVLGTEEQTYEDALRLSREKMGAESHSSRDKKDKKAKWNKKPEKSKDAGAKMDQQSVTKSKSEAKIKSQKIVDQKETLPVVQEVLDLPDDSKKRKKKKSKPLKSPEVQLPDDPVDPVEEPNEVLPIDENDGEVPKDEPSAPSTPEVKEEEVMEEPIVVNEGLHVTAAGKMKKGQKKKLVIEDVDGGDKAKVPVNGPVIVKEEAVLLYNDLAEGEQASPTQEKLKGKKKVGVAGPKVVEGSKKSQLKPQDLLIAVKKTTFEDDELQSLIDILLNKQQGSNVNGGWVERGGQGNEIKQLEKLLQETRTALKEEISNGKSLNDRFSQVRQEINIAKAQQAQAQRIAEGHQQELQTFQQRVQAEEGRRMSEIQNLQNQITFKHQQCQQLQSALDQMNLTLSQYQQQPSSDLESIRGELEQTKQTNNSLDQEVNNLRNQVGMKQSETDQLQNELKRVQARSSEELLKTKEEAKKLEMRCSALERESMDSTNRRKSESEKQAGLESKVEQMSTAQKQLEADLISAKDSIKSYEQKTSSLKEENDRLSRKLSMAEEKLKVASACNGNVSPKANGSVVDEALVKKLEGEKEDLLKQVQEGKGEIQSILKERTMLQTEVDKCRDKIEAFTRDLKDQKEKNDALRNRNWKAMDALNKIEQSYQGLLNDRQKTAAPITTSSNDLSEAKIMKEKQEVEKSQKKLLSRLFPEFEIKEDSDFSSWMDNFSTKVSSFKSNLSNEPSNDLKKQVNHYKKVLNDTESILHRLQSSIETEEFQWKQKLAEKQSEVDSLKRELSGSNTAMQNSLDVVQSAEEMEGKLVELQEKLLSEEENKKIQTEENRQLVNKIDELKELLEGEQKVKADLGEQVARMNQLVATGQEALQQEQKTMEVLRDQVASLKAQLPTDPDPSLGTEAEGNPQHLTVVSEAKTPTQSISSSQISSIGSLDQSENSTPKKDKKSKKKKLLGLLDISKKKKSPVSGNKT